jgi:hypothetical protein
MRFSSNSSLSFSSLSSSLRPFQFTSLSLKKKGIKRIALGGTAAVLPSGSYLSLL